MTDVSALTLSQAAQQAAAANAAAASSSGTAAAAATATGANALQQLGSNFNQFLTLLTTQLQNQDPTSPMDTNQFTEELVQFTGVQQSVATNTNLTQLIGLQQGADVLQSANVVGHKATVSAGQIALQNSVGEVTFAAPAAEQVQLAIVDSAGNPVRDVSIPAQAGANSWSWDGRDDNGNQVADGAYGVALETGASGGTASAVPFSVVGTATGLVNGASGMQLQLGALSVGLDKVQSIAPQ
jgi:flagellar basal-body rod modification protein FlgD